MKSFVEIFLMLIADLENEISELYDIFINIININSRELYNSYVSHSSSNSWCQTNQLFTI